MNKIIDEQLKKVELADLSNFDPETNTYLIKKRIDIKLEENNCYLIHLKPSFFSNETIRVNWNSGSVPSHSYIKADISKIMGKMIRVVGIYFDMKQKKDLGQFWNGWLPITEIEILQKL